MHQNLPEIYHVPAASQQHNVPQCPQGSDGWIRFAHHRQAVRGRQWTPQAFVWHSAQSIMKPTRATGVNTWNCLAIWLHIHYYTMPMTTVYMTVPYMTVADTTLAPINEQLVTFVYSFHLCLQRIADVVMCIIVLQWAWACISLAKQVHMITGTWYPWLDYTCRCTNWLLTYFEMSRHTWHYFSA